MVLSTFSTQIKSELPFSLLQLDKEHTVSVAARLEGYERYTV